MPQQDTILFSEVKFEISEFWKNSEIVSRLVIVLLEEVGNFRGFRVFNFGPYIKIENSENSEIVSILKVVLLEEVGNFRGLQAFDFGPYTKIENSENSEIVSRLAKLVDFFCFFERKLESSEISEFSVLTLMLKSETRKIFQNIFKACKVSLFCLRTL